MSQPDHVRRDPPLTVRIPDELNERINEVWEERGYASRSEFVRDALRSAVEPRVTISEEFLEHIRVSEEQKESGDWVSLEDLD